MRLGQSKKAKKEKSEKEEFHVPVDAIAPIAAPLAGKKLSKKLFKTVKKGAPEPFTLRLLVHGPALISWPVGLPRSLASKARQLKRGVKEVVKSLRKGEKGLLLLASNITPIDILSHLPVLAEEAGVKYCWVLAKSVLCSDEARCGQWDVTRADPGPLSFLVGRSSARLPAPSGRRRASSFVRRSARAKPAQLMMVRTPTGRRDGTSCSRR